MISQGIEMEMGIEHWLKIGLSLICLTMGWSFVSGMGSRRDEGDVTRTKKDKIFEGSWFLL